MDNAYTTPSSELNSPDDMDLDNFDRFSAWGVLGLSIITLGVYYMYWFYTRTVRLNEFSQYKISMGLVYTTVVTYVVYLVGSFAVETPYVNDALLAVFGLVSLVYIILYLVWVFKFRGRILDVAVSHGRYDFTVNPVLTFFLQAIYLQYRINVYIDDMDTD